MATVFRSSTPRHGPRHDPGRDGGSGRGGGPARDVHQAQEAPEELLRHACELLRLCAQDTAIAAVLLAVVAAGVITQLAHEGWPGPVPLVPLLAVVASFTISAGLVVRSRRTLMTALGAVRAGTGAPLDPAVPWTPAGLGAALDPRVRDLELRRLLAAAYRCGELAWRAVLWGVGTSVLFVLWTTVLAAAGTGA